jgi:H+/gluconate symporter-like permease
MDAVFILFLTGSLLGVALEVTGSAQKIGDTLVGWLGSKNVIWVLFLFVAVQAVSGAGVPIFLFWAFSMPLLRAANLPKSIGLMLVSGVFTILLYNFNLSPAPPNLILGQALNLPLSLSNGPLISFVPTALGMILMLILVFREAKKATNEGRGFYREGEIEARVDAELRQADELPSFVVSISPIIVTLALIIILQKAFGWNPSAACITSQMVCAIACMLINKKRVRGGIMKNVSEALHRPIAIIVSACCVAGFARVLTTTIAYSSLTTLITELDINPYVLTFLGTCLICAVTADGIGGVIMFTSILLGPIMATGVANPVAVQRIAASSATTFDSLPHSYMVHVSLNMFGYDLKSGYKYMFLSTVIVTLICAVCALGIALLFY